MILWKPLWSNLPFFYRNFVVGQFHRVFAVRLKWIFWQKARWFFASMGYSQVRIQKIQKGVSSTFTIDLDTFDFSEISKKTMVGSGNPGPPLHAPLISQFRSILWNPPRQTWPGFTESSPFGNFWLQWALWTKSTQPDFQTITSSRFYSQRRRKQLELIVWNVV